MCKTKTETLNVLYDWYNQKTIMKKRSNEIDFWNSAITSEIMMSSQTYRVTHYAHNFKSFVKNHLLSTLFFCS